MVYSWDQEFSVRGSSGTNMLFTPPKTGTVKFGQSAPVGHCRRLVSFLQLLVCCSSDHWHSGPKAHGPFPPSPCVCVCLWLSHWETWSLRSLDSRLFLASFSLYWRRHTWHAAVESSCCGSISGQYYLAFLVRWFLKFLVFFLVISGTFFLECKAWWPQSCDTLIICSRLGMKPEPLQKGLFPFLGPKLLSPEQSSPGQETLGGTLVPTASLSPLTPNTHHTPFSVNGLLSPGVSGEKQRGWGCLLPAGSLPSVTTAEM